MNEIVVGIDFSKGALNALKYTAVLAKIFNLKITMIWVDKPFNPDSVYKEENNRDYAHRKFEELINEYEPLVGKGNILYKIRSGKVYDEIATYVKINKSLFIVVGTHGISGFEELWIGSNANRIVSTASCPVFTLKQNYNVPKKIERILVPIDRTEDTDIKVPFAIKMAKQFKAEIILVKMYATKLPVLTKKVDNVANRVCVEFEKQKIKYSVIEELITNTTSNLLSIIDSQKADLMVIMTEQQNLSSDIMLGEMAMQVVNNSPVPILSIHPDDKLSGE